MKMEFITLSKQNGISTLTLNRPDKRNAMHGPMIAELSLALTSLSQDDTQVLLIAGAGEHFCAGADISWMQQMATGAEDQNYSDTQSLADLLYQLYHFSKPTIVLAHGATFGGGLGLLCACDIALVSEDARFGFPEVKIGITPSIVSPYVLAAMGIRAAQYYFLSGNLFDAKTAQRLGLVHEIVSAQTELLSAGIALAQTLQQNSPKALKAAKQLLHYVNHVQISEDLAQKTAEHLAEIRVSDEAREGLQAFLEKRKPKWMLTVPTVKGEAK